ncbi:MAG: head decoration protein [Woeseia sp.]|nr:head decoration protein [Woeseia sp.]
MTIGFAEYGTEGTYAHDNLIGGDFPRAVTRKETLNSGQNLTRGAVLGKITTGGDLTLSLSASGDGSETPFAILAADCDASGGDTECLVYIAGNFNEAALTIGTGHTADSIREGLRGIGIIIQPAVAV